jgi:quercetin dioxygenase-like cupin family protein
MRVSLLIALVLITGLVLAQQTSQKPVIVSPKQTKVASSPSYPSCYTFSVVQGDPKASSSFSYVEASSGCTLPTHFHTANEQVTFTSGTGQLLMTGEDPKDVSSGMFYYIPAKHQHQFKCKESCTLYLSLDGPIDIHYVDAAGNELTPVNALATVGEVPGAPVAQK